MKKTRSKTSGKRGATVVIGSRERIALPEWGVKGIKAKIDSGARTSAIDVKNIEELSRNRVRFQLIISRGAAHKTMTVEAPIVRRTRVKSSFGHAHDRLVVRTQMVLGPIEKEIELSLVSRKSMLCRMLIGRAALTPEFLVDCAHRYMW